MTTRLTRDQYGLRLAEAAALRADCTRRQVGAVIIAEDGSVIATGYNGLAAGKPGCLSAGACPRGQMAYPAEPPVKIGDPDPTGSGPFCDAEVPVGEFVCTLDQGHSGAWHIAGDGDEVCAVWPTGETQPANVAYEATGCRAVHAEVNAIIRAGRERCIGATIYVTDEPCFHCSVVIEGAGLARVVTPTTPAWLGTTLESCIRDVALGRIAGHSAVTPELVEEWKALNPDRVPAAASDPLRSRVEHDSSGVRVFHGDNLVIRIGATPEDGVEVVSRGPSLLEPDELADASRAVRLAWEASKAHRDSFLSEADRLWLRP